MSGVARTARIMAFVQVTIWLFIMRQYPVNCAIPATIELCMTEASWKRLRTSVVPFTWPTISAPSSPATNIVPCAPALGVPVAYFGTELHQFPNWSIEPPFAKIFTPPFAPTMPPLDNPKKSLILSQPDLNRLTPTDTTPPTLFFTHAATVVQPLRVREIPWETVPPLYFSTQELTFSQLLFISEMPCDNTGMFPIQFLTEDHRCLVNWIPWSSTGILPIQFLTEVHKYFFNWIAWSSTGILPIQSLTELHRCLTSLIPCSSTGMLPTQFLTLVQRYFFNWIPWSRTGICPIQSLTELQRCLTSWMAWSRTGILPTHSLTVLHLCFNSWIYWDRTGMFPTHSFTLFHRSFTSSIPCWITGTSPTHFVTVSHFFFTSSIPCSRVGMLPIQPLTDSQPLLSKPTAWDTIGMLPIQPLTVCQPCFTSSTAASTVIPSLVASAHQPFTLSHKEEMLFLIPITNSPTGLFSMACFMGSRIFFFIHFPIALNGSRIPFRRPCATSLPTAAMTVDGEWIPNRFLNPSTNGSTMCSLIHPRGSEKNSVIPCVKPSITFLPNSLNPSSFSPTQPLNSPNLSAILRSPWPILSVMVSQLIATAVPSEAAPASINPTPSGIPTPVQTKIRRCV